MGEKSSGTGGWRPHHIILVKVDPDLEGLGEAAGGGVGCSCGGPRPEVAAYPGDSVDLSGGGGGGLQGSDLQVVSVGDQGRLAGIDGGHTSTHGAHSGGLGGVQGRGADTIRGLGGGGGDVGAVADGAVAPVPPYADVVILVTQMGLGSGNGRGGGVPVEAGNCP